MKKYLAFALALIMALALIPGIALADKGGWAGTAAMAVAAGDPAAVIPAVAAVIPAVSRAATLIRKTGTAA